MYISQVRREETRDGRREKICGLMNGTTDLPPEDATHQLSGA